MGELTAAAAGCSLLGLGRLPVAGTAGWESLDPGKDSGMAADTALVHRIGVAVAEDIAGRNLVVAVHGRMGPGWIVRCNST